MAKVTSRPKRPLPELTDEMYEAGRATNKERPTDAIDAKYDRRSDRLVLTLRSGMIVAFLRKQIREIADASPSDVARVEVQPGGDGISIRSLDVDISVAGLLAEELGPVVARGHGRRAHGKTSRAKAAASRANGRKGGRPKKVAKT